MVNLLDLPYTGAVTYNPEDALRKPIKIIAEHLKDETILWRLTSSQLYNRNYEYGLDITDGLKDIDLVDPIHFQFTHEERTYLRPFISAVVDKLFMAMVTTKRTPDDEETGKPGKNKKKPDVE